MDGHSGGELKRGHDDKRPVGGRQEQTDAVPQGQDEPESQAPIEGPPRRFRDALEQARVAWRAADPAGQAVRAGCETTPEGLLVPFFGRPHLVTHPEGDVTAGGKPAHAAVAILLLHYLERADGTPVSGEWLAFRELPDGLFYWPSFTSRAEGPIAAAFGDPADADAPVRFRAAAAAMGGEELGLADESFAFAALPRLRLGVLVWRGDEDFAAEARIVFDASAGHYLPAEDLTGLAEVLSRRLIAGR